MQQSNQRILQSSLAASIVLLFSIICTVYAVTEEKVIPVDRGYTVSPTQTQQCQKICVTATQIQTQSCIYTQTQAPYLSQCVTAMPTTCYKYVTKYKEVCCEQEYEQQNYQQEQVCQQYCQLSYQQSVSYPCQTQIYYPCQEYKLVKLQQCCQIPKLKCVQYTQACITQQVQEEQAQQLAQQEEQQVEQEAQQVQQVEEAQQENYYG
ncbi:hypothetical protein Gasu2_46200 [Galdieria sulphuraria]|uniref:Uncharacterized protein n=1 Tax=Galdieria sulphuraria TaxID=130081 RepID=M2Y708_GALSU|nr:uncharacterized protein Gasu_10210 [Galdieria sulphuraria]EME31634.1 hypothetical protein Gasu_10210 [Galdieria sulphuraria]GJD10429.1 hypothetical protein Gasu2_46200 [Galdieria sulphuraria]|eukprot:XP_005708154.1 hypothetical protein Gasu_10210 [Galdieria sulphuraria]